MKITRTVLSIVILLTSWVSSVNAAKTPVFQCPQWHEVALQAGWRKKDLLTLDYIMWRESRCHTMSHNTTLNRDGSEDYGLTQINDWSWCRPTRYQPEGYLQSIGVIDYCIDLFNPLKNLKSAKMLYDYGEKYHNNGWKAWGL